MDAQVVGRDGPLAELERFLREIEGASASLVIEGEPGIGKSTLWQKGVDLAAERRYVVLVSRPAESESALAYSGLADLLARVDAAFLEDLPGPQRRALEVALLLSEPAGRAPEPRAIFAAFAGILRSISREAPVLVAVDDRQWLDKSSARALGYVSRRLEEAHIGVLVTVRLDGDVEPESRSGLGGATVLRLIGLSPAALHQLIKTKLDVSLPRSTVLRVHRTTDGNPFFALELARVLVVAGLPSASEPWPVPDDLREMVTARVGQLPRSVRSVLLAAAAGSRRTISGLGVPAAQAAERAGVVTIGEHGLVRFAHPLFAGAVYGAATPDERRTVHAALAGEASDIEERARHRALACIGVDEQVALLLDQAAVRARARGAPDVAAELEERAVALTPVDLSDDAWRRRVAAAEYLLYAGDLERARTLLVDAVGQRGDAIARSRALRLLGEVCYRLRYVDEAMLDLVAGARCRALVLAARGDVAGALEGLDRTLAEQAPLPMPLELARTLIVKGQLHRRRKQKRAAGESLRRALALCEAMGAELWAERARSELGRVGVAPGRDDLSPTETRVAALAASGLTNREIAASAFMSQKTVEANLSRIYRKLGIRSRAELGVRIAAADAQRSPSGQPGRR